MNDDAVEYWLKEGLKTLMEMYISNKEILARPMTRGEYNKYRDLVIPENEDPSEEGYLVEYPGSPNKVHPNHEFYISWSPKDVFDPQNTKIKDQQDFHSSVSNLLKFFEYTHLPQHLQKVSMPFCKLAYQIASSGSSSAELTVALRKLLESKDCAVRAVL